MKIFIFKRESSLTSSYTTHKTLYLFDTKAAAAAAEEARQRKINFWTSENYEIVITIIKG
jgi:phage-related baseplate assembly protein